MQIETTVIHHCIPVKMAKIRTVRILNAGENVEKLDYPHIAGGNVKQYSHSGKEFSSFLQE